VFTYRRYIASKSLEFVTKSKIRSVRNDDHHDSIHLFYDPDGKCFDIPQLFDDHMINECTSPELCSVIPVLRTGKIGVGNLIEDYIVNEFSQLEFSAPILRFRTF
jgi:hypothetical protein